MPETRARSHRASNAPHWLKHSDELTETRNRADDLAHCVLACLLAGIGDDLAGDALHLSHAQAGRHQSVGRSHDAAHPEHRARALTLAGTARQRLSTGHLVEKRLHLFGW